MSIELWRKSVEIQYDVIQRNAALYVAIVGAVVSALNLTDKFAISSCGKYALVAAVGLVLLQASFAVVLAEVEREANWKDEWSNKKRYFEQSKWQSIEKPLRRFVSFANLLSALALGIALVDILIHSIK